MSKKQKIYLALGFVLATVVFVCIAANPSFSSFNSTQFGTNGFVVSVANGAILSNINDSSGNLSISIQGRTLSDGANTSLDYGHRDTLDVTGAESMDYNSRFLINTAGINTVQWGNELLVDTANNTALNWNNRTLLASDGTTVNLNWSSAANGLAGNGGGITNIKASNIVGAPLFISPDLSASIPGIQMSGNGGVTFDFGNTQNTSSDAQLRLRAPPWTTLSGISAYLTGTNPTGGTLYGQSGTTNMYYYDPFALSIGSTPMQAVHSDLPGVSQIVMNGEPFAITSTSTGVGGTPGNYASIWVSPTNNRVYFPKFTSGKLYPTGVNLGGSNFPSDGGPIAFTVETDTGNADVTNDLHFGGLLFGGSGQLQETLADGHLNAGAFSATQGGSATLDTTVIRGTNFLALQHTDYADGVAYSADGVGGFNYSVASHGIGEGELGIGTFTLITWAQGSENGGSGGFNPGPTVAIGYGTTNQGNTIGNATLQVQGSIATYLTNQTANYTDPVTNSTVLMNGSTLTNVLPDASFHAKGRIYIIKNINASPLTLIATNNQTFDGGGTNISILQNESVAVQSDGANWQFIGGNDGGLLLTNWVSGQLYTNVYGQPVEISGNATLTVAAVSGAAVMALRVTGTQTNFSAMSTTVTSIAESYTNYLSIKVPAGGVWTWTNLSTGAGNSASVNGGQLMTQ